MKQKKPNRVLSKHKDILIFFLGLVLLFFFWLGIEPTLYNHITPDGTGKLLKKTYDTLDNNWKLNLFICVSIIIGCIILIVKTASSDWSFHIRVLLIDIFFILVLNFQSPFEYARIRNSFNYKDFLVAILMMSFVSVSGSLLMKMCKKAYGKKIHDISWVVNNVKWIALTVTFLLVIPVLIATLNREAYATLFSAITAIATVAMVLVQGTIMIRQRVETTFYLLVGQWRDVANNIEFGQNWFHGQSVFKDLCNRIESLFHIECQKKEILFPNTGLENDHEDAAKNAYEKLKIVDKEEYQLLENYFKNLEHLLHYIKKKNVLCIPPKKKKEFMSVIKSHLSTFEQRLFIIRVAFDNDSRDAENQENLQSCYNLIYSIIGNNYNDKKEPGRIEPTIFDLSLKKIIQQ